MPPTETEEKPTQKSDTKQVGQGLSFIKKNRRKLFIGGGLGATLIGTVFGFMALLPFKILHIEQNLFKHNFSVEESVEKKLGLKLLNSRLGPYDEQGKIKITGRGFFGNKWGTFRVDRFEGRLAEKGVSLKSENGKLVSIESGGTTEDVSKLGQVEKFTKLYNIVTDNVPWWRIGERVKMIRLMTIRYGVSFKFWTGEQIKDFTTYLKERSQKVRQGASAEEIDAAKKARDGKIAAPENPTAGQAADAAKEKAAAAAGDEATAAVQDEFNKNFDIKAAVKKGATKIKGSKALGFTGLVMMACGLKELADTAVTNGYTDRAKELMRMGGALLSASAQIQGQYLLAATHATTGKVTSQDVNFLMQQFEADSKAKQAKITVNNKTVNNVQSEDGLDFTQAAAWKRATGQTVGANDPELAAGANPDAKTGLTKVMDLINSATGAAVGAGNAVCAAALSPVGIAIAGVELAANLFDAGAEEIIATSAKLAFQTYITIKVLPDLLSSAAGLAITGTENAVQQIAMADGGMALMATDKGRATGMMPATDTTYGKAYAQVREEETVADRGKSLSYQLVAIDNPNSILSKIVDSTPSTTGQAISGTFAVISNFKNVLFNSLLSTVSPAHAAATAYSNPNQFQNYLISDDSINKYDPIDIINYFEKPVTQADGSDVARIDLMGDPDKFAFGNEDANKNDALHCFVNSFRNPYQSKQGDDPVCLNIGYLTQGAGITAVNDQAYADGIQKNIYNKWCDDQGISGSDCPFKAANDEMTRYSLYLGYQNAGDQLYNLQLNNADTKTAGASLN
jgi:hypothetical protein